MKKVLIFLTLNFFFSNITYSDTNIAFLDVQYIIDRSILGIKYKKQIDQEVKEIQSKLKKSEVKIKEKENEISDKKNILKKDEISIMISELNNDLNEYQVLRKTLNDNLIKQKREYSKKILKILNPLLTNYVETNNIKLVIEKKNILVGMKTLDITSQILEIFNEETKKTD
ncbi:hypothetical protein AKH19_02285 [Pelagibacteraceae bacterium GOM-A1]|nr:hypothetical protein AKH19_02285 [Pelagibacteraceae bacterium GOM-A1]